MPTILICHGAWSAGWAWKKLRPLLQAAGHEVFTPTYTGLGERAHLTNPMITLDTHIQDILNVITYEDLHDIILIGRSYGGMVATGVANRMPERIRHLIYLDAFVPQNGQSLNDLRQSGGAVLHQGVEGWLAPPNPSPSDTSPEDLAWIGDRRRHQPVRTFTQKIALQNATPPMPRTYIYCAKKGPGDHFAQFADRAKGDPTWTYVERDWSHSPNITAPESLAQLFTDLAATPA